MRAAAWVQGGGVGAAAGGASPLLTQLARSIANPWHAPWQAADHRCGGATAGCKAHLAWPVVSAVGAQHIQLLQAEVGFNRPQRLHLHRHSGAERSGGSK